METHSRVEILNEFYQAPKDALFNQRVIAAVRDCSISTLERDRWAGQGVPFIKIGRLVFYRKKEVLDWLNKHEPMMSCDEAQAEELKRATKK
jgi:hypothetical protein